MSTEYVAQLIAERDAMKADLASLAYWYCANCERRIPDADVQRDEDRDAFCPYSTDQLEWSEPETLTSVRAYAEKMREAKNRAFAERDEAWATLTEARRAARRMTSALIAVSPLLETPYTDAPEWTPWTRYVGPAIRRLREALGFDKPPTSATQDAEVQG